MFLAIVIFESITFKFEENILYSVRFFFLVGQAFNVLLEVLLKKILIYLAAICCNAVFVFFFVFALKIKPETSTATSNWFQSRRGRARFVLHIAFEYETEKQPNII